MPSASATTITWSSTQTTRTDVRAEAGLVDRAHVGHERELLDERAVARLGVAEAGDGLTALVQRALELFGLLLEATCALLQRLRDLAEDGEERGVEQQERESEHEGHRLHGPGDLRFDRPVVVVELEHAAWPGLSTDADRHVGGDHLDVLACPALVVQVPDLAEILAGEDGLELLRLAEPRPDELVLVRVHDSAVGPPELDADDPSLELGPEQAVERSAP
jgi:hypothetical protein